MERREKGRRSKWNENENIGRTTLYSVYHVVAGLGELPMVMCPDLFKLRLDSFESESTLT